MSSEKHIHAKSWAFFPEPDQESQRALLATTLQEEYDRGRKDAVDDVETRITDLVVRIRRAGW